MVQTGTVSNNIFRRVYHIQLAYIHHQAHWYFGLTGIGNVGNNVLPKPLLASALLNLSTSAQEVNHFYDKVHSYMISKAVEELITKTYIKKLRIHHGEYE